MRQYPMLWLSCVLLVVSASIVTAQAAQVDEAAAASALDRSYAIRRELSLLNISHRYVTDVLIDSQKAFDGQNVTLLSAKINSISNPNERASFIAALNTTFTKAEIAMILSNSSKIRFDYARVISDLDLIVARQRMAYDALDQIMVLEQQLASPDVRSYNMTEVRGILALSKQKFLLEQLDEIPPLLDRGFRRFEDIQIEEDRAKTILDYSRRGIIKYASIYWWQALLILAVVSVLAAVGLNELSIKRLSIALSRCAVEEKVVGGLIVKAQKDYFQNRSISKSIYEIKAKKYDERRLQIKERIPLLTDEIAAKISRRRFYIPWKDWKVSSQSRPKPKAKEFQLMPIESKNK
ncbi:MAG: hypothetical protein AABX47_04715 [Nanoarchaeota archaeon]